MTEETKTEDLGQEEHEEQSLDIRNDKAFLALKKQLLEERQARQALEDERRKEKEKREKQELEARGEYETITKQLEVKLAAQEEEHNRILREMNLRTELIKAGAQNERFIKGAIADYDGETNITEYVTQLKDSEQDAAFFSSTTVQAGNPTTGTAKPGTRSGTTNWAQVREDLKDPAKAVEADAKLRAYFFEHGRMPP